MSAPFDRVTIEKDKMGGRPCIRGMRMTVRRVVELISDYRDWNELVRDYPDLEHEDLRQALQFALAHMEGTIDPSYVAHLSVDHRSVDHHMDAA